MFLLIISALSNIPIFNKNSLCVVKFTESISKFPTIFLANEFFDALPIKQFICKQNIWYEKYIISKGKSFKFVDQKIKKSTIEKLLKQKNIKKSKIC